MSEFTHLDAQGNPNMVDVSAKAVTRRIATAQSKVWLPVEVREHFTGDDIATKKGPVFQTAILAGTMAVKQTHLLIPLCHPLVIEKINLQIEMEGEEVVIECTVGITGKTGVEMEALTGASVAALTVYDMCKAFSHEMIIHQTCLLAKSGGKRDIQRKS
ncbi:MAG: cyclic pyranopterin monophosphate synthase MoaC [Bacteroidota bacterium]